MSRLTPCPSCHVHVLVEDHECPHCGVTMRSTGAPLAAAVVAGLMLVSCVSEPEPEPEYGVVTTSGPEPTTEGTSTGGSTQGTGTTIDDTSSSGAGEVEYGTPDTGLDTGTDTDGTTGTTGTDGTTSVGEPEYGVPETTSSG